MKYLALLPFLALLSCTKDDRTVRYEVDTTGRASVSYIGLNGWTDIAVHGPEIFDTLGMEVDTATQDTTYLLEHAGWGPTEWRQTIDADEEFGASMKIMVDGYTATARVYVDDVLMGTRTVDRYAAPVMLP
jgi:hypothetical protein